MISDKQAFVRSLVAGFLAFVLGTVNFLKFDGYDVWNWEILLLLAAFFLVTVVLSALYCGTRNSFRVLLDGLLVAFATDLVTSGTLYPTVSFVAGSLLSFGLRAEFLKIFSIFMGFVILSTLLGFGSNERLDELSSTDAVSSSPDTSTSPAIVHIILDEHIGMAGFESKKDSRTLSEYLKRNNFTVFDRAFSRHMHTMNAIPDQLNLGENLTSQLSRHEVRVAQKLKYFTELNSHGYAIKIYQSNYIDLCENNYFSECYTYESNGVSGIDKARISPVSKATVIGVAVLKNSEIINKLSELYRGVRVFTYLLTGIKLPNSALEIYVSSPIAAKAASEEFVEEVSTMREGEMLFFHALLPHYPYVFTEECKLKDPTKWLRRIDPVPMNLRYEAYLEQVNCTVGMLDKVVEAVNNSPAAQNSIIIIHGDHGSRLTSSDPKSYSKDIQPKDLVASYSTIFAVRYPQQSGGTRPEQVAVPILLKELVANNFHGIPAQNQTNYEIWLDDGDWIPRKRTELPGL